MRRCSRESTSSIAFISRSWVSCSAIIIRSISMCCIARRFRRPQVASVVSPPRSNRIEAYAGRTAYNVSKFGMTMCARGVAAEFRVHDINANSLWPATVIESLASKNFKMGERGRGGRHRAGRRHRRPALRG